jgi:uncharacterized protein (DUF1778 family)
MKKTPTKKAARNSRVNIRLSEEEHTLLEQMATQQGRGALTPTTMATQLVLTAIDAWNSARRK